MKTSDQIWEEVQPKLVAFEEKRVQIQSKSLWIGGILLAVIAVIAGLSWFFGWQPTYAFVACIPLVFIAFIAAWFVMGNFVEDFKRKVVAQIVTSLDPNLRYDYDLHISESDYMESRLFPKSPDRYRGEDLVVGKLDKTRVEFSEIHSEYQSRDSDGDRTWNTIFKGVFFIADFNKEFQHATMVFPDRAERALGAFGRIFQQKVFSADQLIRLEDPEFERLFAVYAEDEQEARYILTPALMQRLKDFRAKTGEEIHVAFRNSRIYLAIPTRRDLFEPHLFQTLLDRELIDEYLRDIEFFTGIVDDLSLNTRIWTKE